MDPALRELIAEGDPDDEVAVVVRLHHGARAPAALRLVAEFGVVATARAARSALRALHADPAIASLKAPRDYARELERIHGAGEADGPPDAAPDDVRRPPDLPETGRGTVVCVIDWSLDYAHPDFRNPDGSTRLLGLWDQRGAAVPANRYGYGRIHAPAAIDRALGQPDPFAALGYTPAANAHGTHVLGIAAGNGRAGGPQGIAPEAGLIFIHLGSGGGDLGNSIELLEAIDFARHTAGDRPLVINLSLGRHAGPHDGTLLVERAIDWLLMNRPGTAVVQSAGNYYSRDVHMSGRISETRTAHLPFRMTQRDAVPVSVELWYNGADEFTARMRGPGGASAVAALGHDAPVRLADGREVGHFYHRIADPNNGDNLINLFLRREAAAGVWEIEIEGVDVVDGRWHAWIERNAACRPCQAQFRHDLAEPQSTTGSICNALRTIAVGAYDAHDPAHPLPGFSSVGPTRDGRRKPLLAAPGVRVLSVRARSDPTATPGYLRMSGTSMAAPHVAGTIALMMQAAGRQRVTALRRALFATLAPPGADDPRWGYGQLAIAEAVARARALPAPVATPPRPPAPPREGETMSQDLVDAATRLLNGGVAPADFPTALAGEPPLAMLRRALDPDDRSIGVVGWQGQRLVGDLRAGDVLLRHGPTRAPHVAVIADPALLGAGAMRRLGVVTEGPLPGRYVRVIEPGGGAMGFARRVTGPDGLMLHDSVILRHAGEAADETAPLPPATRPTIRVGSSGPGVAEAQTRLNAAHAARLLAGQPGLSHCPLTVDGRFGANTRGAVVAFQQTAFAATPSAWDGVVGPQTWAALGAAGGEIQGLPTRCPGLHQHEVIDRFAFNSADVLPIHQPQIVGIARCIIESRATATPITQLTIIGHTDPVGTDADNDALGLRRAEAVRREILAAIRRMTGRDARGLVIDAQTRGESERVPGDDAANRRVEVVNAFDFLPVRPPVPARTATVEFVLDTAGNHRVDAASPVATAVMFGLWDHGYDAAGDVRNGRAETANFVGLDTRRFYLRVADPAATGSEVVVDWRTLNAARANDDAPASQAVTLTETSAGSKVFVSRALLLVVDNTDADQSTDSGLPAGHAQAGIRRRGQRDHRLRRAALDGFVRADYAPAGGGAAVTLERPVFARTPDARRRVRIGVINYGSHATAAQIATQFANANLRWRQTGLVIDAGAATARPIPAGVLNGAGRYTGSIDNAAEVAALADLIPATTDATLTVVFVRLANGANAYTTVGERTRSALADRSFIFIDPDVDPQQLTLAHEFHHALFNRFDTGIDTPQISERPFFTFNTLSPSGYGVALPDDRVYRRIQSLHAPDPNNDAANDHIVNWIKRRRTQRFPIPAALAAPDATTGNLFVEAF